ncbi:MAG: UxaA family hydrolase, partial [Verrucomicrobiota bacterium]
MSVVPGSRAVLEFEQIAGLPDRADNAAIALRTIEPGERVLLRHIVYEFTHTVLEGHRFAVYRIEKGGLIRSWGKPFGIALRPIEPGEYLANNKMLQALNLRKVDAVLPSTPNFQDFTPGFEIEDCQFGVEQVRSEAEGTFMGFHRQTPRGIGTRNFIVLLGTDSLSGAFVQRLSSEFAECTSQYTNIDGVVPVAHTEGGSLKQPLNLELTLRTLAGFAVHPNVGAVLMIDSGGSSSVSNDALQEYCRKHSYPLDAVVHEFHSRTGRNDEEHCRKVVRRWLKRVDQIEREKVPFSGLKIGLQCGGSDAFSGITANPVLGMLAQETIARGGSANLAETDELIGAENYVLERVRDLQTAESFLAKVERFKKWAALHGHSAEGNPSGGNLFRGLYNITLKSLGAARKKSAATRLDCVIDFAEQMSGAGFYFMDSPGNDLESIAGQVAAGCNLILFATGNGSITNFPFVPTLKVMTTTGRFEQLKKEMDVDAGRLLTGETLEKVTDDAFEEMLEVISGKRTAGEIAGHSQVQLWREWRGGNSAETKPRFTGEPAKSRAELMNLPGIPKLRTRIGELKEKAALILPTSLCAGEIARKIAERLNQRIEKERLPFSRAVTLPHTEGCGNSGGESEELFIRTMVGYLTHPLVGRALLLEHGCEKTHNDAFRNALRKLGIPEEQFGWCGIQSD